MMPERYVLAIVPDGLWARIKPVLPRPKPLSESRRLRAPDRAVLAGILFVMRTGVRWMDLPPELDCSGSTCLRRLKEWHLSGVWAQIVEVLMTQLTDAKLLEWSRVTLDPADTAARKRMSRPPAGKLLELIYANPIGSFEAGGGFDEFWAAKPLKPASGAEALAERLTGWLNVKYPADQAHHAASDRSSPRKTKLSADNVRTSS